MKYLYKILRLFFCPHKYSKEVHRSSIKLSELESIVGYIFIKECSYCKKLTETKFFL